MKRSSAFVFALYIGFMSLSLQSYIWGEKGLLAYQRLSSYADRLEENEQKLEEIQNTLEGSFNRYLYDRETIALAARSLGYYRADETKVLIEDYQYKRPYYLVGRSIGEYRAAKVDKTVFRIVSVLLFAITYIAARFRRQR